MAATLFSPSAREAVTKLRQNRVPKRTRDTKSSIERPVKASRGVQSTHDNNIAALDNLQLNEMNPELRFPAEIESEILSYFVLDGFQVSNDMSHNSDMATVHALLKTSRRIRCELLHQIFRRPLQIHITNGKLCGCKKVGWWRSSAWVQHEQDETGKRPRPRELSTLLIKKLSHLPLHKWPSLKITLAPTLQAAPCFEADWQHWTEREVLGTRTLKKEHRDHAREQFVYAVNCVTRQSQLVAETLRYFCEPSAVRNKPHLQPAWAKASHYYARRDSAIPKLNYSQAGSNGGPLKTRIHLLDSPDALVNPESRQIPLWALHMVFDLLAPWQWTASAPLFDQVTFPREVVVRLRYECWAIIPPEAREYFPDAPDVYTSDLRNDFLLWWTPKDQQPREERRAWWEASKIQHLHKRSYREWDWYLCNRPLLTDTPKKTIVGHPVLAITTVPNKDPEEEGQWESGSGGATGTGSTASASPWRSKFLASDR